MSDTQGRFSVHGDGCNFDKKGMTGPNLEDIHIANRRLIIDLINLHFFLCFFIDPDLSIHYGMIPGPVKVIIICGQGIFLGFSLGVPHLLIKNELAF